ncbi:ATP/GTP-binding protein [Sulfuracidifex metallicus]|uniref:GTPase n=1 Tax=Sulfuracidifex metallicus DSM 6482 = JCM 9184 TaxID=523847 RepID=A0A6A9QW81_SULME|nr:ATP/GTP-binding protein [Sulfuracidifex metallicus]MUN29963.1 GTPase [Sulfuracidifex metallicus DSM 6482 = JCM 9184]WOE51654.1 ATP/GTP-binding protein [Sulfuracidifex metallicus DSM 6482 = JCM 9184]
MYFVFFVGTAGSGKTTLVKTFNDYLRDQQMDSTIINLDPAVESLPYTPAVDVRDYVDAYEVMEKFGLGPNSSLIAASDLVLTKASEIKEEVEQLESNYVLVDTPGQIELFAYRETGRMLASLIAGENKRAMAFLIDSFIAKEARSFVSMLLLSSSVKFRMDMPTINLLSKVDLLTDKELDLINSWSNGEELVDSLGTIDEYSYELIKLLVESLSSSPIPVSSTSNVGMDMFYAELQRIFAGGEDFLTEEGNPTL